MRIKLTDPFIVHTVTPPEGGAPPAGGGTGPADAGKGDEGKPDGDKKFTQADIDRAVRDRLARERPDNYAEIKRKAEAHDAAEAEKASEVEKATKKTATETEQRVRAEMLAERVLDRVELAAAEAWADTHDARLRLAARARAGEFVDKRGEIDREAIKAAVADELKAAPHLAKTPTKGRPAPDSAQGTSSTGRGGFGVNGAAEAARRFGTNTP